MRFWCAVISLAMSGASPQGSSAQPQIVHPFEIAEAEPFVAACGFEIGLAYEFRLHHYREQGGEVSRDAHGRLVLTLSDEDVSATAGEDGLLVLATIDLGEQPLTRQQLAILGLTQDDMRSTAEFLLDWEYNVVGLRNWKALRDQSREFTAKMTAAMVRAGQFDEDTAGRTRSIIDTMTATEQGMVQMYGTRVYPYMYGYGWQLGEHDEISFEVELPSPIGGAPLLAVNTTSLRDDPATPGVMEYASEQRIDPASAAEFLQAFMDRLGADVPAETREQIKTIQIDDLMAWDYDHERGLITRATLERVVVMPTAEPLTERWTWELVETD